MKPRPHPIKPHYQYTVLKDGNILMDKPSLLALIFAREEAGKYEERLADWYAKQGLAKDGDS